VVVLADGVASHSDAVGGQSGGVGGSGAVRVRPDGLGGVVERVAHARDVVAVVVLKWIGRTWEVKRRLEKIMAFSTQIWR